MIPKVIKEETKELLNKTVESCGLDLKALRIEKKKYCEPTTYKGEVFKWAINSLMYVIKESKEGNKEDNVKRLCESCDFDLKKILE